MINQKFTFTFRAVKQADADKVAKLEDSIKGAAHVTLDNSVKIGDEAAIVRKDETYTIEVPSIVDAMESEAGQTFLTELLTDNISAIVKKTAIDKCLMAPSSISLEQLIAANQLQRTGGGLNEAAFKKFARAVKDFLAGQGKSTKAQNVVYQTIVAKCDPTLLSDVLIERMPIVLAEAAESLTAEEFEEFTPAMNACVSNLELAAEMEEEELDL